VPPFLARSWLFAMEAHQQALTPVTRTRTSEPSTLFLLLRSARFRAPAIAAYADIAVPIRQAGSCQACGELGQVAVWNGSAAARVSSCERVYMLWRKGCLHGKDLKHRLGSHIGRRLDRKHTVTDGSIAHETNQTSRPRLFQVLGPGLVTGAADDDPSGIATYSQVGAQFGYGLAWTLVFSYP
jgi:hypothetical protein